MHRQTIEAYDADAQHWLDTRYRGEPHAAPYAADFRRAVGDGVILDIGCGPGQLLGYLGTPTVGVDASIGMLDIARQFAGSAPLVQADAEALPVRSGGAAGAFASFSLQHLPRANFSVALAQLRHALSPAGLVEIFMHNGDAPNLQLEPDGVREDDDVPGGRWFTYWKADEVRIELTTAGFSIVEIQDLGFSNRYRARVAN